MLGGALPSAHPTARKVVRFDDRRWEELESADLAGQGHLHGCPAAFGDDAGAGRRDRDPGGPILDILASNLEVVRFVVAVTVVLLMTVPTAFLIIYMEMKIIALMNLRIGPDRVGPFGSLLSVVHGLKVLMKEDFTPTGADSVGLHLGPGRDLPGQRHDPPGHPVRTGSVRSGPQHRLALLLRHRRAVGRRPVDGRLVELQQVLAARRSAVGGAGDQLRDPADAVGGRADPAGGHDEPEHHRR